MLSPQGVTENESPRRDEHASEKSADCLDQKVHSYILQDLIIILWW